MVPVVQEGPVMNWLLMVRREYLQLAKQALANGDVNRAEGCLGELRKARRAHELLKEVLDGSIQSGS